jgi:short-subunit dehydrogenase
MKNIVIFGATSTIAQACARRWSERGDRLLLVARDALRLQEVAADLRVRGAAADAVHLFTMDALERGRLPALLEFTRATFPVVDALLVAHGVLPDQADCERDVERTVAALEVNGVSAVAVLAAFAPLFEQQGRGALAVIGSPAGDRGRASNYTYGAAKALVHTFADGLRHRLWRRGVAVVTIKPGFTVTPMTAGMSRDGFLWARPARVAHAIVAAIDAGSGTVYAPWFWRWIMWLIRLLPEPLFRRTRL